MFYLHVLCVVFIFTACNSKIINLGEIKFEANGFPGSTTNDNNLGAGGTKSVQENFIDNNGSVDIKDNEVAREIQPRLKIKISKPDKTKSSPNLKIRVIGNKRSNRKSMNNKVIGSKSGYSGYVPIIEDLLPNTDIIAENHHLRKSIERSGLPLIDQKQDYLRMLL